MEAEEKERLLQFSKLFVWLQASKKTIKVLQGGSGSSKTYSILEFFVVNAVTGVWQNETIDIVRRTMPALRISAMKDFEDICKRIYIYNEEMHNISKNTYTIGTCTFRFYSADDEEKMRGPRRDRVYFNEVLEMKKMDVLQVMMRTNKEIYMDYNPSEEFHWMYDDILTRDDIDFMVSTYLDNPFLSENAKKEIERLKALDSNLWRIYGLGQRGVSQATIFTNWDYWEKTFEIFEGEELYGLDFGYNDQTAFGRAKYHAKGILFDELLYKCELTSEMLVRELDKLVEEKKLTKTSTIFADSSRPEIIEDLRKAGYNVHPVKKGPDSVLRGINFMKRHKIYITKTSVNAIKELRGYKWKTDKNDKLLDEPVGANDHLIDALRYAISEKARNKKEMGAGIVKGN